MAEATAQTSYRIEPAPVRPGDYGIPFAKFTAYTTDGGWGEIEVEITQRVDEVGSPHVFGVRIKTEDLGDGIDLDWDALTPASARRLAAKITEASDIAERQNNETGATEYFDL